jgi:(1->4)-alpha-D-glucan 1-alpha-D-glucosylmutase
VPVRRGVELASKVESLLRRSGVSCPLPCSIVSSRPPGKYPKTLEGSTGLPGSSTGHRLRSWIGRSWLNHRPIAVDVSRPFRATYRVQLHAGFDFAAASRIADYLAALGVSHLYCSPYLQAAKDSTHGYDIVDPRAVNRELGGTAGHARLSEALRAAGLGQVLDIVPNHMAISGPDNPWWWDVLENGPSSRFASYFDVDWDPPETRFRNVVLLPVLADHYGRVLEHGDLRLHWKDGAFTIRYHDHVFPVSPQSLDTLLVTAAGRVGSDELAFIAGALSELPSPTVTDRASVERRHRHKTVLYESLARLCAGESRVDKAIETVVAEINASADSLDALLERQNFRLAHWRAAARDLGYRRFFDINGLVGLRVEHEHVFRDTHRLVLGWLADGTLDGLRIDHPDGLRDPQGYLERLRSDGPEAWIIVEKILEPGEALRGSWPVDGTTGYDFLNRVSGLFVDPTGEKLLTEFYAEFTGESIDWAEVARAKKHDVMRLTMGSDLNRLTALFLDICERRRRYRDYTRHELHEALRDTLACFSVYRTYVRPEPAAVVEEDVRRIVEATEAARAHRADLDGELFEFLRDVLRRRLVGDLETELTMRFQQLAGPVMAKGVEDTAFYNFNRLVSLNEVGGDPGSFGRGVDEFHRAGAETQERWPRTMLATSTHDTKRSEDVRARLHLISEIPERWAEAVHRWSVRNARHRRADWPDRNSEYLFYQTLVGAWPIETGRMTGYMEKAAREAKAHTSWTSPNEAYDAALRAFVEGAMADLTFTVDVEAFVAPLIAAGRINSLAQTLLKLTAPGIPDIYQGTELWDLSLVDPDNRRPVDYALRERLLADLDRATPEQIMARSDEGLPKLWVIRQTLHLRRRRPELFGPEGSYRPLAVTGERWGHVVAFARGDGVVTVVPRLVMRLEKRWLDTALELPAGRWRNELTGQIVQGVVRLDDLLARFPVALLSRVDSEPPDVGAAD